MTKRPADYITAKRSSRELARIRERIEAAEEPAAPRRGPFAIAAVAAGLVAWLVTRPEPTPTPPSPLVAEPAMSAPSATTSPATSADAAPAQSALAHTPTTPPSPELTQPSAQSLWTWAGAARRAGDPVKSAELYSLLIRIHPQDSRAGLAGLELARMRLDRLDDADGALEAYEFAIAHGGDAFFAEDARAGRVEALERTGDRAACRAARDAFVAAYPRSVHAARVRGMCER